MIVKSAYGRKPLLRHIQSRSSGKVADCASSKEIGLWLIYLLGQAVCNKDKNQLQLVYTGYTIA